MLQSQLACRADRGCLLDLPLCVPRLLRWDVNVLSAAGLSVMAMVATVRAAPIVTPTRIDTRTLGILAAIRLVLLLTFRASDVGLRMSVS